MSQIEITNLNFTYPGRLEPTLNQINITVEKGDFILLNGKTASGKSTLLKAINGLIPHASSGELRGNVRIDNFNVSDLTLADIGRKVGLLFQNPDNQLFCTTVEDEIAFGLENMGILPTHIDQAIDEALNLVGLAEFRKRETSTLSGGEKQLIALASLFAMKLQILLLDEPTSYLDANPEI
ncbi:TPA: ABC transporter ATP-binding protein [Candidatus Poribacteria bacterium]|nr:ABC transporter ATP-binding protein [Candidatus Poribacteria bacterium]